MKKTFIRRLTSTIVALSMISIPMPTGTFAVEPDISTPGTSVTNLDTGANSKSGG